MYNNLSHGGLPVLFGMYKKLVKGAGSRIRRVLLSTFPTMRNIFLLQRSNPSLDVVPFSLEAS